MNKTGQGKINIYCMFKDVLKDLWVALIVGISVSLLMHVGAHMTYQPTYTSRTTFVVSAKGSSTGPYGNLSKVNQITDVFKVVMDSQVLKKLVCEDLGTNHFDGSVNTAVVSETNLVTVSVTSSSPEAAFRQLKSILNCYPTIGDEVLGEVIIEIFEAPAYPSSPDSTVQARDMRTKGFFLGTMAMLVVLALISYFKDTVKNVADIPELLDTTELATLGHEKKSALVSDPRVGFGYAETIKKIRTKLLYKMHKTNKKIIYISSTVEGEGKTTLAVNLAEVMSQRFDNVLLIEGNLRKTDMREKLGIKDSDYIGWTYGINSVESLKAIVYQPANCKFKVMLNKKENRHAADLLTSEAFEQFLKEMSQEMDVIIIDGPPAKRSADAEVLARLSDMSLLVVRQNTAQVKFINDTIDMLNAYGEGCLGCVFNDVMTMEEVFSSSYGSGYGYGYGYGSKRYGYGHYGYGKYGSYGHYGKYGKYGNYYHNNTSVKGEHHESEG